MVLHALETAWGGEIFVPKIPSYKILDIAKAIAPECETKVVGIRPGEKLHEEMITDTDSLNTIDLGKYYAILPSVSSTFLISQPLERWINKLLAPNMPSIKAESSLLSLSSPSKSV